MNSHRTYSWRGAIAWSLTVLLGSGIAARAGERAIIQLRDLSQEEVKSGGFTLPEDARVHITAVGTGEGDLPLSSSGMFAYGWIINADTRETVWKMTRENTSREKGDRKFDGTIALRKGSYEVYFAARGYGDHSGFSNFNFDGRKKDWGGDKAKKKGFLQWLEEIFGGGISKDWKDRARLWGIDIAIGDPSGVIPMFSPPKPFSNVLFQATRLGENEHVRQRFSLEKPTAVRIYALGEREFGGDLADYGWIVDAKTRRRVWEMVGSKAHPAGGADKNLKVDEIVEFPAGEFVLYYITDDSHSFIDWNAPPPEDPLNYGVTLLAGDRSGKGNFKLSSNSKEDQNVIAQLIEVGNDEMRSANFVLKAGATVRVYALGERSNSRHQMSDFGWIINSQTRDKVWMMDLDRTEHAGGADKNRMIDETVNLSKGSYTVFYQSDDSHAYNTWNAAPPFDPEHWGITVTGEGGNFEMGIVEKNSSPTPRNLITQIVRVGNGANLVQPFTLDKPTHIRVYALGEGQNHEMYDYGWIENTSGGVVWEMTYSMTFHAGGGRKNRMVSTTIVLDKGKYTLHYVSDDSHSFNHWNADPPDDPTMWGITLLREE